MEKMSEHDKAIRLCEGGIVEIDGHFVRATRYVGDDIACNYCDMDSICHGEMAVVCAECDCTTGLKYILKLANTRRK